MNKNQAAARWRILDSSDLLDLPIFFDRLGRPQDKQDVDREFRELTLQRQLAAGEAVRSTSRREEPRAVPGVPGATVQTDEELSLRELLVMRGGGEDDS